MPQCRRDLQQYPPFGTLWTKQMHKLKKAKLIDMLKNAWTKQQTLTHQLREAEVREDTLRRRYNALLMSREDTTQ